jgi:hypothetical protein
MDGENVAYVHNAISFSLEEWNHVLCSKMNGTGDPHIKQNKPYSEIQILYCFSYKQNLYLKRIISMWKWGVLAVGRRRRVKEEGKGGWKGLKYFIHMYENGVMKPIKNL